MDYISYGLKKWMEHPICISFVHTSSACTVIISLEEFLMAFYMGKMEGWYTSVIMINGWLPKWVVLQYIKESIKVNHEHWNHLFFPIKNLL